MSVPEQAPRRSRRSQVFLVLGILVALAVIVVVSTRILQGSPSPAGGPASAAASGSASGTTTAGTSTSASASASASASSGAKSSGTATAAPAVPAAVEKPAAQNAASFVGKSSAILAAPPSAPTSAQLKALATGSALDSALASQAEYKTNGWRQVGSPTVVSTKVAKYEPSAKPPTLTLNVCVDSSKVNVVTTAGTVVRQGKSTDRTLNIMTVVKSSTGSWLVSSVNFPANPGC